MLEAERRLLANALLDYSNHRFVLLSETHIPLFNFSTVYNYLTNSTTSFVEIIDQPGPVGRGRYNPKLWPHIKLYEWRKGSQWFELDRALAVNIISDRKYFNLFKAYCKDSCYGDEHYIPTFVYMKYPKQSAQRSLTWVDWSRGGPHPRTFQRTDVTVALLNGMRSGELCSYNGVPSNYCYLFARKFSAFTLDRLLHLSPAIMGFG